MAFMLNDHKAKTGEDFGEAVFADFVRMKSGPVQFVALAKQILLGAPAPKKNNEKVMTFDA